MTHLKTTFVIFAGLASAWAQVEPSAGTWQTWILSSGSQMRLPAPPDDSATANELASLKTLTASADDLAKARIAFWDAGSPAYRWTKIAAQEMVTRNIPAPLFTRDLALVSAAIYDATVAAWDSKYTWNRPRPAQRDSSIVPLVSSTSSPSYPSEYGATAGAAAAVLSSLFPDKADAFASMAAEAARSRVLAGAEYPSDSDAGLRLGQAVGVTAIAFAKTDKSDTPFTGSFPPAPGRWSNATVTTPLAGTWRPWVLSSGSQLRLDAPPAADSTAFADQLATVQNQPRTNTTQHSAWFWQPSFITPWLDTAHREIFESGLAMNAPRAARVYAFATIAQHDATIACWDTKFAYLEPRPSMADPSITPLFANPTHPGFPSGHACASASSAVVLGYLFPSDISGLADQATDAGMSTFYAGIHTMFDVQQGFSLGNAVGQLIIGYASVDGSQ